MHEFNTVSYVLDEHVNLLVCDGEDGGAGGGEGSGGGSGEGAGAGDAGKAGEAGGAKGGEGGAGGENLTLEQALAELSKTRSEAASRRAAENELKKRVKAYEDEKEEAARKKLEAKGEWEKLRDQAEAKAKLYKERMIRAELRVAAQGAGVIDPAVVDLIKMDGLDLDEATGEVKGVAEAVASFKTSNPKLFAEAAAATTTVTTTGNTKPEPPPASKPGEFDASKLSAAEYEAAKQKAIYG